MTSLTQRVVLLLFASGFCGLVYQMAWLRLLRLVFGASTAASAAVLAIFMGGLGLGSLLLGPRVDRVRNPLALYAGLEIGISVAAGVSPLLIAAVRAAYIGLGGTDALGGFGGTAMRLVLSALVLGVPTFLMGGTLPATVRAVTRAGDVGRRTVGLLYAVNTLGAVTGTVATVFWAIEMLGISRTVWVAALLNLLVAVSARALARSWAPEITSRVGEEGVGRPKETAPPKPTAPEGARTPPRPVPLGFILAAAALVGFAFFLMELVWYRMLAPVLGGTSYTFGSILAVALAGIGLGGLLYALGRRERPPTLLGFGATCALEAVLLIIPFALGDRLAFLALALQGLDPIGFGGLIVEWTTVTAVVVLPPALVAGYQFPLLVGLVGQGRLHVGREVGATYAWNTLGAITGSVAGGFGLLPLLTAPGTWRWTTVGLALLAVAAVVLGRLGERRGRPAGGTVPVVILAGVALLLATAPGPSAYWRHSGIGGRRADQDLDGPNAVRAAIRDARDRLIWEAEGRESSVSLIHGNGYTFMVNGKTDGSALGDAPTQVMSGLVGAMLHPDPSRALVIGLGTGSTAGWLAALPGMERVDVIELEPAVIRVAEACAQVNRRVLERDNVNLIVGDGREFLLTTDRRYDVIFSEPSNPYRAGISSLFTREFYRAAVERLAEDGLFIQWLQGYEIDASVVRTAYGTLASVFPAVESWRVDALDLLLVAGREPVAHDWGRVAARAAREPYETALEKVWGVRGAAGFYSGFLGGPGLARTMAEARDRMGEPLNTDDHPVIEYGFVRNLGRKGLFEIDQLADLARRLEVDRPTFAESPAGARAPDWHAVEEAASARGIFLQEIPDPSPTGAYPGVGARVLARRSYLDGRLPAALAAWEGQDREPAQPADLLLVAESMAAAADDRAPAAAERLRPMHPAPAEVILARYRYETGELARATAHLESFFEILRDEPWLPAGLEHRVLQLADWIGQEDRGLALRLFAASEQPFAAGVAERNRRVLRLRLAASAGFEEHCVEAYEALEPHVPWEGPTLNNRLICYRENGHPLLDRARAELAAWNRGEPPRLDSGIE